MQHTALRIAPVLLALAAVGAAAQAPADPPFDLDDPARIEIGRMRYAQSCAGYCHGGGGVGGRAPDFLGRGEVDAGRLFGVIQKGRKGPGGVMPRWESAFSPEEIWELVAYLKHLGLQPAAPPR